MLDRSLTIITIQIHHHRHSSHLRHLDRHLDHHLDRHLDHHLDHHLGRHHDRHLDHHHHFLQVSVPDALSGIAVVKEGHGDMAVSNAIGRCEDDDHHDYDVDQCDHDRDNDKRGTR